MVWNTEEQGNMIPKAEAIKKIIEMAEEQGIRGDFKVFYNDELVADPNNLPETVDIDQVSVSTVNKNG